MRLYFKNLPNDVTIDMVPTISNETYIYSNDGIYIIIDAKIYSLDINDNSEIKELDIQSIPFIQDNTIYHLVQSFYIPDKYIVKNIVKEKYEFQWITLIIEKNNNKIDEAYIEIKDKHRYTTELGTLLLGIK